MLKWSILLVLLSGQLVAHETNVSKIDLAVDKVTLEVSQLEPGVYQHTSYKHIKGYGKVDSHGLVVVIDKQAYIIDTPWSDVDTLALLDWIEEQGLKPKLSLSTHFHDDRTAGIGLLNRKSIPTYTSKLTDTLLRKEHKTRATNIFESDTFDLMANQIQVFYPGPGHSEDNIVVWLPKHQLLFGGCFVRSLGWSSLGNIKDANVEQWDNSVKKLISRYADVKTVVPGHGKVNDSRMLQHTLELVTKASESLK